MSYFTKKKFLFFVKRSYLISSFPVFAAEIQLKEKWKSGAEATLICLKGGKKAFKWFFKSLADIL